MFKWYDLSKTVCSFFHTICKELVEEDKSKILKKFFFSKRALMVAKIF